MVNMGKEKKISVIIPCFNEKKTLTNLVDKVLQSFKFHGYNLYEVLIIDDFSTDGSKELIEKNFSSKKNFKTFFHNKNMGKGATIKTAKKFITGDIIIIQDADLEYDPKDYGKLIKPILNGDFKVVYGSRVLNQVRYRSIGFSSKIRIFGNHLLTLISNFLNNQKLTDAHTCYKVFNREVFDLIKLEENDLHFAQKLPQKLQI